MEMLAWATELANLSGARGLTAVGGVHGNGGSASYGGLCVAVSSVDGLGPPGNEGVLGVS